jgi:hypothetical protein
MGLIKYKLEDGGEILVEVASPEVGLIRVARPENIPIDAADTFQKALDKIKPIANAVKTKLDDIPYDEISVEFALKLTANAGAILTSMGADATFRVNIKWIH